MTSTLAESALGALPASAQGPLQELVEALEKAAGSNLAALVVYGSAVRGGYEPGRSDIDVIVVLHDTGLALLEDHRGTLDAGSLPRPRRSHDPETRQPRPRLRRLSPALRRRAPAARPALGQRSLRGTRRSRTRIGGCGSSRSFGRRDPHAAGGGRRPGLGGRHRRVGGAQGEAGPGPPHALLLLKGTRCDDRLESVLEATGKAYGVDTAPLLRVTLAPEAAHAALRRCWTPRSRTWTGSARGRRDDHAARGLLPVQHGPGPGFLLFYAAFAFVGLKP